MKTAFDPDLDHTYDLPAICSWPAAKHRFDERSVWAVRAALAAGRPLLVRGEPGIGKSQLARAAALVLEVPFLYQVIDARCECGDLLYSYDAVSRLAAAQVAGAGGRTKGWQAKLDEERFVRPGVLWWAFDWQSAREQNESCNRPGDEPPRPEGWQPGGGCVVLIDEIDKADSDLPNSLLESLGNTGFQEPHGGRAVALAKGAVPPLLVVTTNEERELPAAFLRRCLVLQLKLPEGEQAQTELLIERGKVHHADRVTSDKVYQEAARQLLEDRARAERHGPARPGPAEYLDLLRALGELCPEDEQAQLEALRQIADFALRKNPDEELR